MDLNGLLACHLFRRNFFSDPFIGGKNNENTTSAPAIPWQLSLGRTNETKIERRKGKGRKRDGSRKQKSKAKRKLNKERGGGGGLDVELESELRARMTTHQ